MWRILRLAACFLCVACLCAGCGAEGELLSGLRREEPDTMGSGDLPVGEKGQDPETADAGGGEDKESDRTAEIEAEEEEAPNPTGETGSEVPKGAESICVHICGAVVSPGVYEMPGGSRFYEAVEIAGGFAEDACRDYLNMAAPLADGSRLEIPTVGEIQEREEKHRGAAAGAAGEGIDGKEYNYYTVPEGRTEESGSGGASSGGLVNINTADMEGLCALPGVGEGRAKAIIEYREKQGGFQKKEDIMQVSGIGEKMYARMEEYLTVE